MSHYFTRTASLVLAFGFFISCTSLQSSNQYSDSTNELSKQEINNRLTDLDNEIASNPEQADLYYQKGKLLTSLAKKEDSPTKRTDSYSNARSSLDKALTLYQDQSESASVNKITDLLNVTWSLEHNKGIELMQPQATDQAEYGRAAAHFHNATIIIPDSANAYTMKARALYNDQQPKEAIATLEQAQKELASPPSSLLEQLAFLYLEHNDPQKAVAIYEQAQSFSSDNMNVLHGLANAYIDVGDHGKAVEILKQLIDSKPQNVVYRESLATELYFLGKSKLDAVIASVKEEKSLAETNLDSAKTLISEAEKQFKNVLESNSNDQKLQYRVAQFYYNSASKYQQLLAHVNEDHRESLQELVTNYLSASVPLLEVAAERNPDNQNIWDQLYRAYTILGMEREAENAKDNL